jgi:hypothetical protein
MEKTLEEIQKELEGKEAEKLAAATFLFLDISSTCVGYCLAKVDFVNKKAKVTEAGGIWLPDVAHEHKYNFMYHSLVNYFDICKQVDYIVYEMYNVNPKKMTGVMVVPEMIGTMRCAMAELGINHSTLLPQQWRSTLKIKKNEKKDYKAPTKAKVLEYVKVPETVISNVTGHSRNTPSDVYDAIAIGLGWLLRNNFNSINFDGMKFQDHIGRTNQ